MNVFILSTGRSGSMTFAIACRHISNYSSSHEGRVHILGDKHFDYPNNHIESDSRLNFFLGRLDEEYGDDAIYIHLQRNLNDCVESWSRRHREFDIIKMWGHSVMVRCSDKENYKKVAEDYVKTMNSNIRLFLKDKTKVMDFKLENAKQDFKKFWTFIKAEGDFSMAIKEWDIKHNAYRKDLKR